MLVLNPVSEFQPYNRFKDCPIRVFVTGAETTEYDPFLITVIIYRIHH